MVILVPITVNKNKSFQFNALNQNSQCHEDTNMNRIMSYLPKAFCPVAREEVLARIKIYNLCWKMTINDLREYNWCAITPWHESWYNEGELCTKLYCTEEEAKSLINSNPVIFTGCYFFYLHLCNPNVFIYEPSEWCPGAKEGWRFLHCESGWTLLQCPDKYKINEGFAECETLIIIKKPNVALVREWKKDDNGLMLPLDLPCCIFNGNKSEEFQYFLDTVDAFA